MKTPIVFLHGWAMHGASFDDVAARLAPDFEVLAPDLPGHGTRVSDTPSLERCVDVLEGLVNGLDRPPVLAGWSMGAAVAWKYLARHGGGGLRALITMDMSPRIMPDKDWSLGLKGQSQGAIRATAAKIEPEWRRMVRSILRNMYASDRPEQASDEALALELLGHDPAVLRPLWEDLVATDERASIGRIDIPYLVCCGAKSRLYSAEVAQWIARQAQQAQVHVFPASGHSPHLEEPAAFCEAVRSFVAASSPQIADLKWVTQR